MLQLFTMDIKAESIYKKLLKMPSLEACVHRPSGLIKRGRKRKGFSFRFQNCFHESKECFARANSCY